MICPWPNSDKAKTELHPYSLFKHLFCDNRGKSEECVCLRTKIEIAVYKNCTVYFAAFVKV